MKLGIWLPLILKTPPHVTEPWEEERDVDDIAAVASVADQAGYEYLFAAEHVALPVELEATRGNAYWCPFSTLGFVAAHTRRAQLVPLVLVAAYHHPMEVAKRMATLDMFCKGRAGIGIGVGSLVQEFEMLGHSMKERGRRADDMLRALIACRGKRVPEYEGEFWSFRDMLKRLQDNGVTGYAPELEHQTREIYFDQLRAMAEIAKEF